MSDQTSSGDAAIDETPVPPETLHGAPVTYSREVVAGGTLFTASFTSSGN